MNTELGKRISAALKDRGMTQKELAERVWVTEATMSRYISGERNPTPEVIANIATALCTTSDYLLGIDTDSFDFLGVKRMLARNAMSLSTAKKKELIIALLGDD